MRSLNAFAAFAAFVGVCWILSGLAGGRITDALAGPAIAAVAGFLPWRDLRNPEAARRLDERAAATLTLDIWDGAPDRGPRARVATCREARQDAPARTSERGDFDLCGTKQGGWIRAGAGGLPERVRFDHGTAWKSCPVPCAVAINGQGTNP